MYRLTYSNGVTRYFHTYAEAAQVARWTGVSTRRIKAVH